IVVDELSEFTHRCRAAQLCDQHLQIVRRQDRIAAALKVEIGATTQQQGGKAVLAAEDPLGRVGRGELGDRSRYEQLVGGLLGQTPTRLQIDQDETDLALGKSQTADAL